MWSLFYHIYFFTNTQRKKHSKMHLLLTIVQNQVDVYLVYWHLFKEFFTCHGFSSLLQRLNFESLLLFCTRVCVLLCKPIFKRFILIHDPGNQTLSQNFCNHPWIRYMKFDSICFKRCFNNFKENMFLIFNQG